MTTTPDRPTTNPLRGVATISLWADDVAAARDWYADLFGIDPYFVRPEAPSTPQYVEFRIGDRETEVGIVDRRFAPVPAGAPGGAVVYWAVDDLAATYERLLAKGATSVEEPTDRGQGFITAAVLDPFGNIVGLMSNPHYQANA